jgi:nucleoside-diphosphate-sugar epimerase
MEPESRMSHDSLAHALRGRSVAVYGGTGLIGGTLTARLAALRAAWRDSSPVYAVSRRPLEPAVAGVMHVRASVLEDAEMAATPRADLAVFVAGATSNYLVDPLRTVRVATEGFDRFLRHTAGAARRLLVGSARLYGPRSDASPLREEDACHLRSPDRRNVYDGAKLIAEALALHTSTTDQPVMMTRLGNVYGPALGRAPATAFTAFVAEAQRSGRIVVSGPPGSLRNHVHVRDAADGLIRVLALGRSGEAYNIGSRDHVTNEEFARKIAAAAPFPVEVELANPGASADHMVISIEKAEHDVGFVPACPLEEHLPLAVRAALEHCP